MKVLVINGSPHEKGCVYTSLCEVTDVLNKEGIETELFQLGDRPIRDCNGCAGCKQTKRCVFNEDGVNECIDKLIASDGLLLGSPVYYAGPRNALCSFLDRMFYLKQHLYSYKAAASIVNCRRGGASAALDRLNKYFGISRMPLVASQYWAFTHGTTPEEVKQDLEGMQVMRTLGRQMAWLLKAIAKEGSAEVAAREEAPVRTNFIR